MKRVLLGASMEVLRLGGEGGDGFMRCFFVMGVMRALSGSYRGS